MVQNQPTLVVFHLHNQRSVPFGTSVKSKCFFRTNFFELIDMKESQESVIQALNRG